MIDLKVIADRLRYDADSVTTHEGQRHLPELARSLRESADAIDPPKVKKPIYAWINNVIDSDGTH